MIRAVLFDLDGTLLPMEMDKFIQYYFSALAKTLQPCGYDPKELIDTVWRGTGAMVQNDGKLTNEEVFWRCFTKQFGEESLKDIPHFDAFYREVFPNLSDSCGYNPEAKQTIEKIKAFGYRVALATNPLFPATAIEARIRWAGLEPEDFLWYTTYENSRFCKPNPGYYREQLDRLSLSADAILMVGNDADEDFAAREVGMQIFMLTDCLINKSGKDLSDCPQGGFSELLAYLEPDRCK